MSYLAAHDIRLPVRVRGGPDKGELEWHRANRPSLRNLFANPIYAGAYAYGMRAIEPRRQKPGRPGTGRRPGHVEDADVFLPDRLPAYITLEQYRRNRAQLQSNRPGWGAAARAGSALLSGLVVCGHCGLRMLAQYNNNGQAARYTCSAMRSCYGEPLCQSLKAAPLDGLMGQVVLQALQPAALEASLALAADVEAEQAALDRHWQQRLERMGYQVDRARRHYAAVEPESRLVARTLERAFEEALSEQAGLEAEYERFRQERRQAPSPAELAAIRGLAQDLPSLWQAQTTTQAERQTLVRLVLERVVVDVIDGSEQVRVECHWHGGNRTCHRLTRPVARLQTLSTYTGLVTRAADLQRSGHGFAEIAAILNREGWRPAKRRETFNAKMVHHLLIKAGVVVPRACRPRQIERRPDEWTICELAETIGMPKSTLYTRVQQGRLRSRRVEIGAKPGRSQLVYADPATIAAIQTSRSTPAPWHRRPPPLTQPQTPNA